MEQMASTVEKEQKDEVAEATSLLMLAASKWAVGVSLEEEQKRMKTKRKAWKTLPRISHSDTGFTLRRVLLFAIDKTCLPMNVAG